MSDLSQNSRRDFVKQNHKTLRGDDLTRNASPILYSRMLNSAKSLNINETTKEKVTNYVLSTLKLNSKVPTSHGTLFLESLSKSVGYKSGQLDDRVDLKANKLVSEKLPDTIAIKEKALSQIKFLVQSDAEWDKLRPHVIELLKVDESDEIRAKMLEVCCLHGNHSDIIALMDYYSQSGASAYYTLVHPKIRESLTKQFWGFYKEPTAFTTALLWNKENENLSPVEKLFVYFALRQTSDLASSYLYFRTHRKCLFDLVSKELDFAELNLDKFLLYVATHAFSLGIYAESLNFVEQISNRSDEYTDALDLVTKIKKIKGYRKGPIEKELLNIQSWQQRIKYIDDHLTQMKLSEKPSAVKVSDTNSVLEDLLTYIPEVSSSWAELSRVLVNHFSSRKSIPAILEIYKVNSLTYHPAKLDLALWQPIVDLPVSKIEDDLKYLHAVGLLHRYIAVGKTEEAVLWKARDLLKTLQNRKPEVCQEFWHAHYRKVRQTILKSNTLSNQDKEVMLRQLAVVGETKALDKGDIRDYVSEAKSLSMSTLAYLINVAKSRRFYDLEAELYLKQSQLYSLSNEHINRLWILANLNSESDLAWRILTVVKSREVLRYEFWKPWELTPENRRDFNPTTIGEKEFQLLKEGFTENEIKVADFCFYTAPKITDFLRQLDPQCKSVSLKSRQRIKNFEFVCSRLETQPWFHTPEKVYYFGSHQPGLKQSMYTKLQSMKEHNAWSLTLFLVLEASGCQYWNFDIFYLHNLICGQYPNLAGKRVTRIYTPKTERWIRDLTSRQVEALQAMDGMLQHINSEEFTAAVEKFFTRLTSAVVGNNLEALASLRALRTPIAQIWDLESFMLSNAYGNIRKLHQRAIHKPVPKSLTTNFDKIYKKT